MRAVLSYVSALILLMLTSCSDSDFSIEANIQGLGTQNLRVISVDNESLKASWLPAVDGSFTYRGNAENYIVVEFFNRNMDAILRVVVKNGDNVKVTGEISKIEALKIKGSKLTTQWIDWLASHPIENRAADIEQYVTENRKSKLSGLLLTYNYTTPATYNKALALLDSIDEKSIYPFVKTRMKAYVDGDRAMTDTLNVADYNFCLFSNADSSVNFDVADKELTLIHLWDTDNSVRKLATKKIEEIRKDLSSKRFRVIDIAAQADTFVWKQAIKNDSVEWRRFYAPGGAVNPAMQAMHANNLPLFIVVDSAGTQHYSGVSLDSVSTIVKRVLKKDK